MNQEKLLQLQHFAAKIRLETTKQIATRGFGHLPGSLSVVDALAVLYGHFLRINPQQPNWSERDLLVMSKGHAGPAVYTCLALKGYFPLEWLATLNQPGTNLPSHCDRLLTPGVDMTAGSLGQGISAAVGASLAHKIDNKDAKTYVFLGDGECNEGQVWEAFLFAAHQKLANLTVFIDRNMKQLDGQTEEILALGDIGEKIAKFGFHVQTIDGNDISAIYTAIENAHEVKDKPSLIVLNTVKGKGLPNIESIELNHHIQFPEKDAKESIAYLEDKLAKLEQEMKDKGVTSCV